LSNKGLLINAIDLVEVDGSANVPTMLYYRQGHPPAIGSEALAMKRHRRELNEDFKIDLGNVKPGTMGPRRLFATATGEKKSAAELTADFIHEILGRVNEWMELQELKLAPSVMVAEPISMQVEAETPKGRPNEPFDSGQGELVTRDWLQNYRTNIKRILMGKGFDEERIKFLPEPFAVFQYYRHGKKHPTVADKRQHNALVIDFGGGTFDVCVIETTKEGEIDINDSRRLSKARSAASKPIGGFFVNRCLLEAILRKYLGPKNLSAKLSTGLDIYRRWRRNEIGLAAISEEQSHFVQHFHLLSHEIEECKLSLSRSITDWRLDAPLSISVPVPIPENPFLKSAPTVNCQLSAIDYRDLFITRVWQQQLKDVVKRALDRSRDELNGAPITVVLLSGGSANIKWLGELLRRDFQSELALADILELKDYQEVVSKGLAVECVRRFYEPEGDFASITYNRLCLILDPDKSGFRLKQFHPRSADVPRTDIAGVLLPSSSALGRFIGLPMRWKVRLDKNPSQSLDYYFLRSSFNPDEVGSLQNVEEHTVHTPKGCKFDSNLQVELTVSSDGTAAPKFIYKTGRDESEVIATNGRPFFLDVTLGKPEKFPSAYIGLDFGTSNTSVSFINQRSIETYEKRAQERFWNDLTGLTYTLPYPVAAPLAKYVRVDQARLVTAARDFTEAALSLAAYVAYLEYCAHKRKGNSYLFKGFTQRSAGPLWRLLHESVRAADKGSVVCMAMRDLTHSTLNQPLDHFVDLIAKEKHGKVDEREIDTVRPVQILANLLHKVFAEVKFGLFQQVQKPRLGKDFGGIFRHATGRPPFVTISKYSGESSFAQDDAYIVYGQSGLSLQPLIFWNACPQHPELDCGHCYLYDCMESPGVFSFKAAGAPCTCTASVDNDLAPLAEQLVEFSRADPVVPLVAVRELQEIGERGMLLTESARH
jgi:hypothetical protein